VSHRRVAPSHDLRQLRPRFWRAIRAGLHETVCCRFSDELAVQRVAEINSWRLQHKVKTRSSIAEQSGCMVPTSSVQLLNNCGRCWTRPVAEAVRLDLDVWKQHRSQIVSRIRSVICRNKPKLADRWIVSRTRSHQKIGDVSRLICSGSCLLGERARAALRVSPQLGALLT
jgi:hypothetical protein